MIHLHFSLTTHSSIEISIADNIDLASISLINISEIKMVIKARARK